MTPQQTIEAFWRDGFVHLEAAFAPALMDELTRLIEDHFGAAPPSQLSDEFAARAQTEIVPWFPQREGVTAFDPIENDPTLRALTTELLGPGWVSQYCMVMFSKTGSAGQAWHQDCPPEQSALFNLNRLIYTSDILDAVGGQIVVCPGSHRLGEIPAGEGHADLQGQVVLCPRKGDLVLLHGHTWHRVMPIKTLHRFSVNFRAAPNGAPDDLTDVCVYRTMRYRFSSQEVLVDRTLTLA